MKKLSKKEFRSLLSDVACLLINAENHHFISDREWALYVWQYIARTALLGYPQNDITFWQNTYDYLHRFCD